MRFLRLLPILTLLHASRALAVEPSPTPAPSDGAAPQAAPATECTDKPEVCGRHAFERAVHAYRDSDFETAIREFRAALSFKWHPSIALNLGLAEAKAGRYTEAIHDFETVLASEASDAKLREEATKERARASAELASIDLDAGEGPPPVVRVDGATVDASATVLVDPGLHRLEVEVAGGSPIRRDITLAAREHLRLSIDRTREIVVVPKSEPSPAPSPVAAPPPTAPAAPPARNGIAPVWFFVGAGATVATAAVAAWSAFDTKRAFDAYERDLPRLSQADADQRVTDGHGLETRTNVLWAVTGVLALGTTAVGVFLVDWKPSAESAFVIGPGAVTYRRNF